MKVLSAEAYKKEFDAWTRGDRVEHAGLWIEPKRDLPNGVKFGWVVTNGGIINELPGATWARTRKQAMQLLRIWLFCRDLPNPSDKFWALNYLLDADKGDYP